MQLPKPALGPALHHQLCRPAGMQQGVARQRTILDWNRRGHQCLLQHAAGLEEGRWLGFATAAPALTAALPADHTHQQLAVGLARCRAEHLADLKGPEAGLAALKVAARCRKQLSVQVVAQVAVVGQQGVGQRDAPVSGGHQGEAAGFLEPSPAELTAQVALHLLGWFQTAGFEGIGKMAGELVVSDQACHFLNQIDLPLEIHRTGGRHGHPPTLVVGIGLKAAAQGGEGLEDAGIAQVAECISVLHGPKQVVQGIPA